MQAKLLPLLTTLILASCVNLTPPPLQREAWAGVGEGTTSYGVSSSWAFYDAEFQAAGTGGVLAGQSGVDTTDLTPRYGAGFKASHYFTDHVSVGLTAEVRSFEAGPVTPLAATLTVDSFETYHLQISGRYWLDPRGDQNRLRPFIGCDIGYVPDVNFGAVRVDYPTFPSEDIQIDSESYYTMAAVIGASYLWNDHMSVDFGAFYEFPLTPGEAEMSFSNLAGATADVEVAPEGIVCFFGLSFYL